MTDSNCGKIDIMVTDWQQLQLDSKPCDCLTATTARLSAVFEWQQLGCDRQQMPCLVLAI